MTFKDYLEQKRFTPATVNSYTIYIRTFTDWLAAEQLDGGTFTYNELLDFIQYLQGVGKSKKAIQYVLSVVRHYCNYLVVEKQRSDNPAAGVFMKGIMRKLPGNLLSWGDMEELYRQYSIQLNVPLVSKVILGLLIYQGLAAEEITRLEAVHVHLREGRVFVRAMKRTGQRWLPLSALQLIELGEYMQENRLKTGPLLVTGRKQRISPTNINNRMQGMMKQLRRLNPRVINATQFRSSVIAHWLKANNLRQVQYMAGHKYVSSTQRYQLTTLDDLKTDLQQHHPMS
ncbi:MAG TPA: tyrosine-type recombinase/integrase [Puia sp.]|uniref:tyrosine-type recombinase/integrase n=1 Tax=Puia sp. TaxID=2045100 RepID=UPI002CACDF8F|nr:tyrosine-type recombinase/integrase [Puia sp.]HVU96986.1 tyrosine-type recombinase/integrase [Puia sp.]